MANIQPMIFDVTYQREFAFSVDAYLRYCESKGTKPTQKGYEIYCKAIIYEVLMDSSEILVDLDIETREDHISALEA
jgi:hypothetical protein